MANTSSYGSNLTGPEEDQPFYDFVHGLYLYAIPLITFFGLSGNISSFKVFMFTSFRKHPSSVYLSVLCISDTWFLIALFLIWLDISGVICMVIVFITYTTSFLSVWYVVLIMLERYIVVCHPLQSTRLCSKKRAIVYSSVVTIFAILFYIHSFFTMELVPTTGGKIACRMTQHNLHIIRVITYVDTAITFVLPFIVIFFLNVLVIRAIRNFTYRHVSRHEKKYYASPYNTLSMAQMRLTVMLMVVSSVFLVLNLPSHGVRLYISVNSLMNSKDIPLFLAQQVCQMLYYLNFAINFFLYACTSKTFRRCLKEHPRCKSPHH